MNTASASCASVVTRKNSEVWLVGQPIDIIPDKKLPSKGEVLRRLFFLIRTEKNTVKNAASIITQELLSIWGKARIPTMADYNIIPKVQKEYNQWRALWKGSSRRSEPQIDKEKLFTEELANLFDIGHANALDMISISEDKEFLLAQREKGRRGYICGEDKKLARQEARKRQKEDNFERLKRKHTEERGQLFAKVELASSSSSSAEEEDRKATTATAGSPKKMKRARTNIVSQALASALDRTKVSDRNAVYVLSATAATLGHNVEEFSINRSTIRRSRIDARNKIADLLKETFDAQIPLTVHWDGKILPELIGTGKVDRLPVLVSGAGVSKLLGVPKLPSGTGKETAKAVLDCLEEWGIKDRIQAMSFDTTISNTGHRAGACELIEFNLGRDLLNLACRHHIMEIVAQKVFAACDIHSTGPDILLFKRFQQHWQFINQKNFEVIEEEVTERENIINFCEQQLTDSQPRDDYRELLELTIIYLGASPSRGIRFMQPGALHRARWMARVIYAIKICLFCSQFKMTKREQASIKRFAAFAVSLYVKSWFVAPLAAAAPANDLAFLKQLATYNDKVVSSAAIKAFSRHLWYLNELLVSLSFFDSDVSLTVKRDMINALNKDGTDNPAKRINLMVTQCVHEKTWPTL